MAATEVNKGFEKATKDTSSLLLGLLIGSVAMNVLFVGAVEYMQLLMRYLQLMVHLPMVKVPFPAQTILFVKNVIEVAMYDILGKVDMNVDRLFAFDPIINTKYSESQMQQI